MNIQNVPCRYWFVFFKVSYRTKYYFCLEVSGIQG